MGEYDILHAPHLFQNINPRNFFIINESFPIFPNLFSATPKKLEFATPQTTTTSLDQPIASKLAAARKKEQNVESPGRQCAPPGKARNETLKPPFWQHLRTSSYK